jgi:hypothetical protein
MNAVVQTQPAQLPAQVSESVALLQVIERAAADPNVNIEKMQTLLAMHTEIRRQQAESEFNIAMNAAQSEMRPISADAENPQTKSMYATYAKLDRALRPIYTKHGFSLSFDEGDSPKPEHVRVLCYASHISGFTRTYRRDMPADGKGAKGGDVMTKTHAAGAAGSYGARYLLKGIFNVAVGEDDKDGNDPVELCDEKQVAYLKALATEVNANMFHFLKFMKVKSLSEIPAARYLEAVRALQEKGKRAS